MRKGSKSSLDSTLSEGDLVEIKTWRNKRSRVGVVMRELRDSIVSDFSRYEILVENTVVSVRRDLLQKVEKNHTRN